MAGHTILGEAFVEIRPELTKFTGELSSGVKKANDEGVGGFDKLATVGKAAFLGLAGAAVGFGAAAVKAALDGEQSTAQLANAVRNAGGDFDKFEPSVAKASEKMAKLGYENDQVEAATARVIQVTSKVDGSLGLVAIAADLAAARHIDLTTATTLVGKASDGILTPLKKLGIQVATTGNAAVDGKAALDELNKRFGGAAQAQADTYAGKLAAFHAEISNLTEKVGNFLLPVLGDAAGALGTTVSFFEHNQAAAAALAIVVGGPLVVALGAFAIQQAKSLVLSGLQAASKLPQFFLALGAAIDGTTASEVVLNETTAVTHATMLSGATAAVGFAAALVAIGLIYQHNTQQASSFADQVAVGAGSEPQAQLDALRAKLADLQADLQGAAHVGPFFFSDREAKEANQVDALKGKIRELQAVLKGQHADAHDAAGSTGEVGDAASLADPKVSGLAQRLGVTSERAAELADALKVKLGKATDDDVAKMGELNDRLGVGSGRQLALTDAIVKYAGATSDATAKSQAFKTALDLLIGGSIDAERAYVNYRAAVDGLGQKLRDNKLNFDVATKAGRDNVTAVEDAIVAARNHLEAMQAQGASAQELAGAFAGDTNALRDQLTQAGLTKAQIEGLIQQYGLVPGSLNTIVTADVSQAVAALRFTLEPVLNEFTTHGRSGVVIHFAGGGIATAPTFAVVGDSGPGEAVLPLGDPRRTGQVLAMAASLLGAGPGPASTGAAGGSVTVAAGAFPISVQAGPGADAAGIALAARRAVKEVVMPELRRLLREQS